MKLRLKFNLVLGLVTLAGIAGSGVLINNMLQENAREEVLDTARVLMESAMAVRAYTVDEVRPLLALQQKRQFLPQTVPAYSANSYVAKLQQNYPEYSYREATFNPTNPRNRALDWEADVINWFRANDHATGTANELIGTRSTEQGPSLYLGRPIEIKAEACLGCHSTPSAAPETMLETYGSANGFGWQLNEIVGAQIVSVPMALPLQRAESTFYTFMGLVVGVFLIIAVVLNIMLHYLVIKPVRTMSAKANDVSMGALDADELQVSGNDEIATLGASFNRMHRSLANAVRLLDDAP